MNPTVIWVIVFIVALILSVGFLMIVMTLVPAINQFKALLVDLEKTSVRTRELAQELTQVSGKVNNDLDKVDELLDSSKETVETVKHSFKFVNKNILKSSASVLAIIPAIKFGWDLVKKFKSKGGKNGK